MSIFRAQTMTLYLLVLSALGTVFTAEAFEWPLALGIFAATCASLIVPYRIRAAWAKSRMVVIVLMILLASIASEVWLGQRDIISGATLFLVIVLVSRLYTPRTASDAIQVLTLSFVVVLAGSALNTSFVFAPYFVLVIICSIWALTTTHLTKAAESRPEGARDMRISRRFWISTSALAIVIFLQTTVFFVVFPRMGLGYFKPKVRTATNATGFSDRVALGQAGVLQDDSTVVARLEFPEGLGGVDPERLYFRGAALTRFDGQSWSKASHAQHMARWRADGTFEVRPLEKDAKLHFVYYQEPGDADYVFFPETTHVARLMQDNPLWSGRPRIRFYTDPTGDLLMLRPLGMSVQLEGWLEPNAPEQTPPTDEARALPPLDARIAEMAATWRGDATTPVAIEKALTQGLGRGFGYSSTMEAPPEGTSALSHFLFTRKEGHCEYFASALAVMLRQSGVPSRIITGYRGAGLNRFGGYYAVQEYRAHSWVEYWVDGKGWLRADPTPAQTTHDPGGVLERLSAFSDVLRYRWNRYIIEFDLDLQIDAARALKRGLSSAGNPSKPSDAANTPWFKLVIVLAGVAIVGFVALSVRGSLNKRRKKDAEASRLFYRLEKQLVRRGVHRRPAHESALSYFDAAVKKDPALEVPLRAFAEAYLRARFSPAVQPEDLQQMARCLHDVQAKVG